MGFVIIVKSRVRIIEGIHMIAETTPGTTGALKMGAEAHASSDAGSSMIIRLIL